MEKIRMLLGERIKELRIKRGLSQEKLSELIEVDQRNLSRVECGKSFPSKSLDKLALALNLKLPELFEFEHLEIDNESKKEFVKSTVDRLPADILNAVYRFCKCLRN